MHPDALYVPPPPSQEGLELEILTAIANKAAAAAAAGQSLGIFSAVSTIKGCGVEGHCGERELGQGLTGTLMYYTACPPIIPRRSCSVIFVEAFREATVKAAVAGIPDRWSWKPGSITQARSRGRLEGDTAV